MRNPKTTIAGYLLLAGALVTTAAHVLAGTVGPGDLTNLLAALAGLGLIGAQDGGH